MLPASLVTDPLTWKQHLQLVLKSGIVASSWIGTYYALKHLPLSLGAPIRATSPLFTLVGAVLILGERPTCLETVGILTTLGSFIGLSVVGAREGVHFHRNKWIWSLIVGVLLGAVSSLYDKYLLGTLNFSVPTVQCWFSIYLLAFFAPFALGWKLRWWPRNEFQWRWSIPVIALALLVADYLYFSALRQPAALVSVVMSLRRGKHAGGVRGRTVFFPRSERLEKTARRHRHSGRHRADDLRPVSPLIPAANPITGRSSSCISCRCRRGRGRCARLSGRCGRAWPWPGLPPPPPLR